MRSVGVLMLLMAASAPVLAAPEAFEGVIEMKMVGRAGGGIMKVSVAKPGVRSEMSMAAAGQDPATGMRMTLLFKRATPDVAYLIQDGSKSYRELDLKKARESRAKAAPADPVVKKLGEEKVNGYKCWHFTVTGAGEGEAEYWTTRQLLDWDTFVVMQQQREQGGMQKAIKDAGVDGFPVKMIRRQGTDVVMTMDLVKAEKSKLPPSTFEVPAGYAKQDGPPRMGPGAAGGPPPGGPMGGMPPELVEELRKMTPEQRQQFMQRMMQSQPPSPVAP